MTIKPKILVTSAVGHSGAPAVEQLLEKDFPVRAFVRRKDSRSKALEEKGAEIYVGDLFDFRDLRKAMDGVQRAYHCPPFNPNLLHSAALFAVAAEEAKLEVVALMSGWNPHASHPSVITRGHWIANQIYRWMPSVDVIHINPGLFAFDYLLGLPAIVHFGMFLAPFGDGLNAPPSNEDIARVASSVLANPASHIGKSYRPTGPELISPQEIAGMLGKVLDRGVRYRHVPFKMFSKAAIAQGFPLSDIAHLRYYAEELQGGAFAIGAPTDHVREVSGVEPERFESIARRYVQKPSLIHSSLQVGSKLEAIAFLVKMIATSAPDLDAWELERGYPLLEGPVLAQCSAGWRHTAQQRQLNLLPTMRPPMPAGDVAA